MANVVELKNFAKSNKRAPRLAQDVDVNRVLLMKEDYFELAKISAKKEIARQNLIKAAAKLTW